ncbi:GNAT family N-acetyltransferase [Candidatus Woesearchaeota archaeon]|jgi:ribosomal protein S18 acetylase RimI-like enzyme|nr:GNAT family N-acetyltransferase [Candidatus Woesearchaeota archaeon]
MIRNAQEEDFELLVDLDANSGHVFYENNPNWKKGIPEWFRGMFDNNNNDFYIYEENEKIVGAIGLDKDFPVPNSCGIIFLAVLKEEHGKGIGGKLVQFLEEKAKGSGFERIFLYTSDDNVDAQGFYNKRGYAKINEFPGYYGWGQTAFLYGKRLK